MYNLFPKGLECIKQSSTAKHKAMLKMSKITCMKHVASKGTYAQHKYMEGKSNYEKKNADEHRFITCLNSKTCRNYVPKMKF